MRHGHARRLAALTLTAVTAAGLLAACGSSSTTSSSSSSASAAAAAGGPANRAKLVACLKQHGVTLPTRPPGARQGQGGAGTGPAPGAGAPGTGRRRGFFGGGGGGGFANPKFQAAFKACGVTRFGRRGGFGRGGTPERAAITKFVTCVSAHGYKLPKPNFTGKGPVFPAKIETNPKFMSASRACQSQLRPPAGAAPGGSTTTSSGA